jgi:hypothetical protein
MTVILNAAYGRFATVAVLIAGSEAEHSSRVARKIGRPIEGGLNTVAACKSADQRDPFLGCHFGCRHRKNVVAAGRRCALRASSAFKDGGIAGVCAAIDRDRNIRLEAPMKRNHWVCQGVVLAPGGGGPPPQPLRKPTYPAR